MQKRFLLALAMAVPAGLIWFYFSLVLGIGGDKSALTQAALYLSLAGFAAGLVSYVWQKKALAFAGMALYGLGLLTIVLHESVKRADTAGRDAGEHRKRNEDLLVRAQAVLECANGHRALLVLDRSLAIYVLDEGMDRPAALLCSASAQYPPKCEAVDAYLQRNGSDCRSEKYPGLKALVAELEAHHQRGKAK